MAQKEYLKMADVFVGKIEVMHSNEVHDKSGLICEAEDDNQAKYISNAINSHDELVAEVERLRGELHNALAKFNDAYLLSKELQEIIDSLQ